MNDSEFKEIIVRELENNEKFKKEVLNALEAIRAEIYRLNVDVNITWKGDR